ERVRDHRTEDSRELPPAGPESPALKPVEAAHNGAETVASPELVRQPRPSGGRPPERAEDDRGFRGDQRGRRSRRRRPRGQGFPENKYAQPTGPQPRHERPPEVQTGAEPETTAEVIVLPGESLAKYRNIPTVRPEPLQPFARPSVAPDYRTS